MSDTTAHRRGNRDRSNIEDVAALAGVSVATVSRAMRDLPNVAESTRARVRQAAQELAYRADPAAARLATGRSRSVAVVGPMLNGWYFSNVVAGAEAVCAEAGYDTIVMGVGADTDGRAVVDDAAAIDRRVDAIIFVDVPLTTDQLASLSERSLTVVSIGREFAGVPTIGIDDVEVGRVATQHLIDLGHRRIGLIRGPVDDPYYFVVPAQRCEGFESAMRNAGLPPVPWGEAPGNFTIQSGRDAFSTIMDVAQPPTAIFALGDEMAFGVIQAAAEHDVRIPEDLSVIGVDDHEFAPVVRLTTVHQDVAEHGARAARLVIDGLEGDTLPTGRDDGPIRLVERGTTGPPADRT